MAAVERRLHHSMEIISPVWNPDPDCVTMDPMSDQQIEVKEPTATPQPNIGMLEKLATAEMAAASPERDEKIKKLLGFGPKYALYLHKRAAGKERDYERAKSNALTEGKSYAKIPRPLAQVFDDLMVNITAAERWVQEKKAPEIVLDVATEDFAKTVKSLGQERIRTEISPYHIIRMEEKLNKMGLSILADNGLENFEPEEQSQTTPPYKIPIENK